MKFEPLSMDIFEPCLFLAVGPVDVDVVYTQVWSTQPPEDSGEKLRSGSCQMHLPKKGAPCVQ